MHRSYKTEIKPTKEQIILINKTIGVCRYVYNLYIQKNKEEYKKTSSFITGYDFSKWLNNVHAKQDEYKWIKEVSSQAVKRSIMNGERAFKNFFNKLSSYPKFKKKSDYGSFYLNGTIYVKRHLIQLPKFKKIRLKEFGYIPFEKVKSATVSREADKYYVSVLVDEDRLPNSYKEQSEGIGIDIGIKKMLFDSNGNSISNITKSKKLIKLDSSLKRQQRILSRKIKGSENWKKQKLIIQRLYRRIKNIKNDLKKKLVLEIVKRNPKFITIEDLDIKKIMVDKRVSNSFYQIGIGYFIEWLKYKCIEYRIELRQVDRYFPSSQICSNCGFRKPMPLHLRIYDCDNCRESIDRDLNASINLKQAKDYKIIT